MGEAGSTRGRLESGSFIDFCSICGLDFKRFFALRLEISVSFRACFQALFFTACFVRIWTTGFLKTSFRIEEIAKTNCSQFFFRLQISGLACVVFRRPWDVALETRVEHDGFSGGGVAGPNHTFFCAFKASQMVAADLQPAAPGPITAEKQSTWTDAY